MAPVSAPVSAEDKGEAIVRAAEANLRARDRSGDG
jgi:hypothetical protein